jgi:hypothetical protein
LDGVGSVGGFGRARGLGSFCKVSGRQASKRLLKGLSKDFCKGLEVFWELKRFWEGLEAFGIQ